jgi:hypothetical protein
VRPVPARYPDDGDQCGDCEQDRPCCGKGRPRREETRRTGERNDERTQQRPRERDSMAVSLDDRIDQASFSF